MAKYHLDRVEDEETGEIVYEICEYPKNLEDDLTLITIQGPDAKALADRIMGLINSGGGTITREELDKSDSTLTVGSKKRGA